MALGALAAAPPALAWSAAASADETSTTTLLPPLAVPSVTVTVPTVTLPPVTIPGVDLPPVTLPPVSLPPVSLPGVEVPPLTLPGGQTAGRGGTGPAPTTPEGPPSPGAGPAGTGGTATLPPGPVSDRVSAGNGAGSDQPVARRSSPLGPAARPGLPLRLRRAAVDSARQLSFPIGLVLALAGFLLFQDRVDRADPRLAGRGNLHDEELLEFS